MAQLNYEVLRASGYKGFVQEKGVEKVMQFGEGNFLRAFVDDFFDISNEKAGFNGKVVLVQPIASGLTELYAMKPEVYSALVDLCVDICRRNGKKRLLWIADRDKALSDSVKSDEMLLTVHRWFARKSCPGNWLFGKLGDLAQAVNS